MSITEELENEIRKLLRQRKKKLYYVNTNKLFKRFNKRYSIISHRQGTTRDGKKRVFKEILPSNQCAIRVRDSEKKMKCTICNTELICIDPNREQGTNGIYHTYQCPSCRHLKLINEVGK